MKYIEEFVENAMFLQILNESEVVSKLQMLTLQ